MCVRSFVRFLLFSSHFSFPILYLMVIYPPRLPAMFSATKNSRLDFSSSSSEEMEGGFLFGLGNGHWTACVPKLLGDCNIKRLCWTYYTHRAPLSPNVSHIHQSSSSSPRPLQLGFLTTAASPSSSSSSSSVPPPPHSVAHTHTREGGPGIWRGQNFNTTCCFHFPPSAFQRVSSIWRRCEPRVLVGVVCAVSDVCLWGKEREGILVYTIVWLPLLLQRVI